MPTYSMGIFKLPKDILYKINGLYWKFWWDFNGKASKIPSIEWSKLGISMKDGGLGFKMWRSSIWYFCLSTDGGLSNIHPLWLVSYLNRNTFQRWISRKLGWDIGSLMPGGVYWPEGRYFLQVSYGKLAMGGLSRYERINGLIDPTLIESNPLSLLFLLKLRL